MRLLVIAAAVPALSTASAQAQAQGRRRPNDGAEPIEVAVSSSLAVVA